MSRSGYYDGWGDEWALIRWRGAVASALRGRRGQAFLRELRDALDELPEQKLIAGALEKDGCVCALGAVGRKRGLPNMDEIDPEDREKIAQTFGIAEAMAAEIMYENDEGEIFRFNETTEEIDARRFRRLREWVDGHIRD